jgi:hypothetical protein
MRGGRTPRGFTGYVVAVGDRGLPGDLHLGATAGGVVGVRQRAGAGPQRRHLRGGGVEAVVATARDASRSCGT